VGQGFHFGLGLNSSAMQIDDKDYGQSDTESGAGFNLSAGYNFNPTWGIVLSFAAAAMSSEGSNYTLGHGDLVGRFTVASPERMFRPYLELGGTGIAAIVTDEDVQLEGSGVTGAAGFNYFFNRSFSLDVNLRYTVGQFTTVRFGGTSVSNSDGVALNTARFNLGVSIFP
jgi:hypothetical protein